MATKKPTRNVRSKAETKSALDEIQANVETREPIAPREMELQSAHRKEVLDGVKDLSVETAVQKVTSVGLDVSRSLPLSPSSSWRRPSNSPW